MILIGHNYLLIYQFTSMGLLPVGVDGSVNTFLPFCSVYCKSLNKPPFPNKPPLK